MFSAACMVVDDIVEVLLERRVTLVVIKSRIGFLSCRDSREGVGRRLH